MVFLLDVVLDRSYKGFVMATQLAQIYQQLVDAGLIVPIGEPAGQFRYPSVLVPVPTFTTYGVSDTRGLSEDLLAELERNIK